MSSYCARNPGMSNIKKRLKTFQHQRHPILRTEELALCGFYFTGGKTVVDEVTCFFCGGRLAYWEKDDEPFQEHEKFFPDCAFLKLLRKRRMNTQFTSRCSSEQQNPVVAAAAAATVDASQLVERELVRKAYHIFPVSLVDKVVSTRVGQSRFTSLMDLCDAISVYLDESASVSFRSENPMHDNDLLENETLDTEQCVKANDKKLSNVVENFENLRLGDKEKVLQDSFLCKICMDREMGIGFQPCGHLIACVECAQTMKICPLCRATVTDKIRIYVS